MKLNFENTIIFWHFVAKILAFCCENFGVKALITLKNKNTIIFWHFEVQILAFWLHEIEPCRYNCSIVLNRFCYVNSARWTACLDSGLCCSNQSCSSVVHGLNKGCMALLLLQFMDDLNQQPYNLFKFKPKSY